MAHTLEGRTLQVGDTVHYQPDHYSDDEWENGVVKELPTHRDDAVRVVYNCNGEWHRYQDYTSAMTMLSDLKLGWRYRATIEETK